MRRDLEEQLWKHVQSGGRVRDWIASATTGGRIESPKQAWATLEKWTRKGLYDYGVALDLGWLTYCATFPR